MPPRARVGLLLNNSLLSVPVDFACVKANLNRVPLNARLSVDEHARMLVEARVGVLLYGADLRERAIALAELVPDLHAIPLEPAAPGEMALTAVAANASSELPDVDVRPTDVVLTLFTSGTTGTLKAAQHTQASYAAICRNVLLNLTPFREDDVMLHAASLIHASGVFVLPCWLRGARTVIMPGFEPAEFLRLLETERSPRSTSADDAGDAAAAARRRRTRLQRAALRHLRSLADTAARARPRDGRLRPRAVLSVLRPDGVPAVHHRAAAGRPHRRGCARAASRVPTSS